MATLATDPPTAAASTGPHRTRRRRTPNPTEQARRVAWGKKYGALNSAFWQRVHLKERGT